MSKGGGKQSMSEATANSSHTGKPSYSDDMSEVLAVNAACSAKNAPVRINGEQSEMEI